MENAVSVIVSALAVWQVVEIFHHSQLTVTLRKWALNASQGRWVRAFFGKLLSCPFCLSHWVAGGVVLLLWLTTLVPELEYIIWIFAITRLANLGNDLSYNYCRSPKVDLEEDNAFSVNDGPADPRLE